MFLRSPDKSQATFLLPYSDSLLKPPALSWVLAGANAEACINCQQIVQVVGVEAATIPAGADELMSSR